MKVLRHIYCKKPKCSHDLYGADKPSCPECGRPFDPHDSTTFMTNKPGQRWVRWWLGVLGGCITMLLCVFGSAGVFIASSWEWGIIAAIIATACLITTSGFCLRRFRWLTSWQMSWSLALTELISAYVITTELGFTIPELLVGNPFFFSSFLPWFGLANLCVALPWLLGLIVVGLKPPE